jgi:hypothetical protein
MPALIVFIGCLLGLNLWLTRRVLVAPDEHLDKKWLLVAGIWVMPAMGAWFAWDQLRARVPGPARPAERAEQDAWARALETREPAPACVSATGTANAANAADATDAADFDLPSHLAWANGFPWLDWGAAEAWTQAIQPARPENQRLAMEQCRRAWLLHLRDALGPDFLLHESDHALILSSLEPQVVRATASFVAKTRQRITKLLGTLAHLPADQKSVLIVFDDPDSYYHYVGALYPDDGEFAFSGGMFINAGCAHFVTQRNDLAQIEPVIAHELTHSAVAHLALPLWLDEGIAVNTEHKLTGMPRNLHSPQQMHAKHLQFWGEAEIQQFWTGDSFHRPDDGQMLSYDLARVLVEKLAGDWSAFERFASRAARDDAGAQAASEQLGVDLGAWVCALLERAPSDGWAPAVQSLPPKLPAGAPDRADALPAHRGTSSSPGAEAMAA